MGVNVTGLFLLAYLCDVLSVPLLNQVYRLRVPKVDTFGDFFSSVFKVGFWKVFLTFFIDFSAVWESFWETFSDFVEAYEFLLDCTPSCTKTYFLRF